MNGFITFYDSFQESFQETYIIWPSSIHEQNSLIHIRRYLNTYQMYKTIYKIEEEEASASLRCALEYL